MPAVVVDSAPNATAPYTYTLSNTQTLAPLAVHAVWDGTNAAGDFLPCLSFYSPGGALIARVFPDGGTVTAGDTVEVTYAPFLKRGGVGGQGIEFDKQNTGDWLEVNTTGVDPFGGDAGQVYTTGGADWSVDATGGQAEILAQTVELAAFGSAQLVAQGKGITVFGSGPNTLFITLRTGTMLNVANSSFQSIFEVRDDGSLHGKTGKALTFDL